MTTLNSKTYTKLQLEKWFDESLIQAHSGFPVIEETAEDAPIQAVEITVDEYQQVRIYVPDVLKLPIRFLVTDTLHKSVFSRQITDTGNFSLANALPHPGVYMWAAFSENLGGAKHGIFRVGAHLMENENETPD